MGNRTVSFWPLPGGYKHYLEVLFIILNKIAEKPTFEELVKWASKILRKSEGWIDSSIRNVVVYSGLAVLDRSKISLTDEGLKFLRSKNSEIVLKAFINKIWGIREIILWLNEEESLTKKQIYKKFIDFGVNWQYDYQVGHRLMWLRSLGILCKKGNKYYLTSYGEKVAKELLVKGLFPEPLKKRSIKTRVKMLEMPIDDRRIIIMPEQRTNVSIRSIQTGLSSLIGKSILEIEETETENELEVDEKLRAIYSDKLDLTIRSICNQIQTGELILQPEFQREYVWDDSKASRFIESILLDIPTPTVYLAEDDDGRQLVIDGHQRLKSIHRFWSNEFPLKNLTILKSSNGKYFKDLDKKIQRDLLNGIIRAIIIKRESDKDVKFELFERLNTGSVHLNAQELRNCVYMGPYNDLIKDLARNKDFQFLLGLKEPDKRMRDRELVLRFFAFIHTPYYQYKPPMKKFLNDEMRKYRNISKDEANKLKVLFKKSVELTKLVFGDKAFKRFVLGNETDPNGFWEGRVNKALFDIVMFGFTLYEKRQIIPNSDAIKEELIWLMTNDEDFIRCITVSTDKKDHVNIHFNKWVNSLEAIVGFPRIERRTFTQYYKKQLYETDSTCKICGNNIQLLDDAEIDHVEMYWRGGKTIPSNARLVHRYCNRARKRRIE